MEAAGEDSSREHINSHSFCQSDIFRMRNSLVEVVEELKLRQVIDKENEERICHLVNEKHELEKQLDNEKSERQSLEAKHTEVVALVKTQFEDKLRKLEEEQKQFHILKNCAEKEMKAIKDESRAQQLAKYNLEKKIKELETKLSTYERSYQTQFDQMTNLEQKVSSVKTYFQRLASSQTRLDKNVEEAMKLNRLLVSTNRHQQCIVDHQREDIDRLRSQLVKVRAAQQSHPESNEQMVEQLKEIRSLRLSLQNMQEMKTSSENELRTCTTSLQDCIQNLHNSHTVITQLIENNRKEEAEIQRLEQEVRDRAKQHEEHSLQLAAVRERLSSQEVAYREEAAAWADKNNAAQIEIAEMKRKITEQEATVKALEEEKNDLFSQLEESLQHLMTVQAKLHMQHEEASAQTHSSFFTSTSVSSQTELLLRDAETQIFVSANTISTQTSFTSRQFSIQTDDATTVSSASQTYVAPLFNQSSQSEPSDLSTTSSQTDDIGLCAIQCSTMTTQKWNTDDRLVRMYSYASEYKKYSKSFEIKVHENAEVKQNSIGEAEIDVALNSSVDSKSCQDKSAVHDSAKNIIVSPLEVEYLDVVLNSTSKSDTQEDKLSLLQESANSIVISPLEHEQNTLYVSDNASSVCDLGHNGEVLDNRFNCQQEISGIFISPETMTTLILSNTESECNLVLKDPVVTGTDIKTMSGLRVTSPTDSLQFSANREMASMDVASVRTCHCITATPVVTESALGNVDICSSNQATVVNSAMFCDSDISILNTLETRVSNNSTSFESGDLTALRTTQGVLSGTVSPVGNLTAYSVDSLTVLHDADLLKLQSPCDKDGTDLASNRQVTSEPNTVYSDTIPASSISHSEPLSKCSQYLKKPFGESSFLNKIDPCQGTQALCVKVRSLSTKKTGYTHIDPNLKAVRPDLVSSQPIDSAPPQFFKGFSKPGSRECCDNPAVCMCVFATSFPAFVESSELSVADCSQRKTEERKKGILKSTQGHSSRKSVTFCTVLSETKEIAYIQPLTTPTMTNSSFLTQSISGDEPLFSDVDDDCDKSKDKLEVGNECDRIVNIRSESQTLLPRRKRRFKDV